MVIKKATAIWEGTIQAGNGRVTLGAGEYGSGFHLPTRQTEGCTSSAELLGAALAGCFSMAFIEAMGRAGYVDASVRTAAEVSQEISAQGISFAGVKLNCIVTAPGLNRNVLEDCVEEAKQKSPLRRALGSIPVTIDIQIP
jgi:osmotically inducible protein OsmC